MINVYSDDNHLVLKYLKDTEANLQNILIMAGDLNIRDSNWDPCYPFHSIYSDFLLEITDLYGLCLSSHNQQVPTRYSNNINNNNSVINLFFLCHNFSELNNHIVHPELQFPSDYVPLTVNISIDEEFIQEECSTIIKNSEEEEIFIVDLIIEALGKLDTTMILNKDVLENIVQKYTRLLELIWYKHSRIVKITR